MGFFSNLFHKKEEPAPAAAPAGDKIVCAPLEGEIRILSEIDDPVFSSEALGNGLEVLIHVGMDTVELKGKGYEPKVKVGDKVKKGQLLLKFDMAAISAAGYKLTTPVVVTNTDDFTSVEPIATGKVTQGQDVILVK